LPTITVTGLVGSQANTVVVTVKSINAKSFFTMFI